MKTSFWIAAALTAGLLACGNGDGGGQGGGPSGNTGTPGVGERSSGSSTSPGGNGESPSSGSAGASGGGPSASGSSAAKSSGGSGASEAGTEGLIYDSSISDADLDTPITLTMTPFTVKPNQEVYKCQWFGNPFGKDVDLVKMVGHMDKGSHHFFLFNMSPITDQTTAKAISDCPTGGLEILSRLPYLLCSSRIGPSSTRSRTWATRSSRRTGS